MKLTGWDMFFWQAGSAAVAALALVLVLRRRLREFPLFSLWTFASILYAGVAYFVLYDMSAPAYRAFFYSYSLIDQVLQLLVAYEIATHVFAPTGRWAPDIRRTVFTMAGIGASAALLLSLCAHPATSWYASLLLRSNFFNAIFMSELFVGMVVLSHTTGLPWKTHAARIAQGLGTYSLVCVALGIGRIFYGFADGGRPYDEMAHVRGVVDLFCYIFWAVTLWAKAPEPVELPEALKIQIYTLNRQVENDLIRIRSWSRN